MSSAGGSPARSSSTRRSTATASSLSPGRNSARSARLLADTPPPPLLDLLEAHTGTDFTDLWRASVVRPEEAALLDARAVARQSYERTLALAGDSEPLLRLRPASPQRTSVRSARTSASR